MTSVVVEVRELESVLGEAAASPPFERLLALGGRRRSAVAPAAGHGFAAAVLARALEGTVLVLAPDPRAAEALAASARAFLGPERVVAFPAWESLPYEGISPSPELAGRRTAAARRLRGAVGPLVAVAPVQAALQALPPGLGTHEPIELRPGMALAPDALAERLVAAGYVRADVVEHRGEFALRGGIVDVFPSTARRPVRLEFVGDEVESLREFSPATQLSTGPVERAEVHPCREFPLDLEVRARAERAVARYRGQYRALLERVSQGLAFEGVEQALPLLFEDLPVLVDLLPAGSWVVLASAHPTRLRAGQVAEEAEALAEASGWPGPRVVHDLETALGDLPAVELSELAERPDLEGEAAPGAAGGTRPAGSLPPPVDLGIEPWEHPGRAELVAAHLATLHRGGTRILVVGEGRGSLERALEVLAAHEVRGEGVVAVEAQLPEGFLFRPDPAALPRLAVVTEEDLFGRRHHTRQAPRLTRRRAEAVAAELQPGDLAVHQVHGVGRYLGMVRRAVAGSERDYLLLEYAEGDRLYVPSDQVGVVAKYVGGEAPRIHRLGTNDWPRAKARVKRAVRDMAGELVRLYSVRMSVPGHAFGPDTPWQRELEEAFPYEETRDQLAAIEDVKRDMEQPRPMDRLICGDVGYGKTEIAVRAAFKAVMDGKQVAVLVPTTLLAEQHYVTFSERFAPFPVRVAMLSRFVPQREQERTLADLAEGRVDVVIGTHRLLSKDVRFKDLGLLVVDEEQRFGVAHKEQIKKLRTSVDVLTLSATPIPRTLEMALSGIREMSVVETPPEDRQPVLTYVGPYDDDLALAAVRRELLRGGQVFWVHNRVETIDRRAAWLAERVPDARVAVAHGQMDEDRLERVMLDFWDRKADVLVCTTIIESGLDVPSANTLVVERADRLGLAQLYQLRGRVGRSRERAFAYLFFPSHAHLTEEAHERLAAISRFTALGSGFQLALRDLEIRGAGNLLGAEQHGHIAAVGFDTYLRLLQEAVAEMKGEPLPQEREVRIDLPVRAFVPVEWVGQESLRLELYRKVATARDHEELDRVREEAEDRFGRLPPPTQTLFAVASLRITCRRLGVEEVTTYRDEVRLRPVALPEALLAELPERVPGGSYHAATRTLNLRPERVAGAELPAWVEARLLAAVGEAAPAASPR
ncbi:MAG TPA: transcription-repair coupling factor [Actinomycetota bacterium]|nr:transcription-repair coupling factor [Actinomycetota bacterium]